MVLRQVVASDGAIPGQRAGAGGSMLRFDVGLIGLGSSNGNGRRP